MWYFVICLICDGWLCWLCYKIDGCDGCLTHWGRVTHIWVVKLSHRRQAIIWSSVEIKFSGPITINFNEILINMQQFSSKEMSLKMSTGKCRPFCLGHNVLMDGCDMVVFDEWWMDTGCKADVRWMNYGCMVYELCYGINLLCELGCKCSFICEIVSIFVMKLLC